MRKRESWLTWMAIALLCAGFGAANAGAVEWQSLESPPFKFRFLEESRPAARALAPEAPRILAQLEKDLGMRAPGDITVTILPTHRGVVSAGEIAPAPHWAVGFVPSGSHAIHLRGELIRSYPFEDLLSLFGHEMTHVLLDSLPGGAGRLPRWFHEGVAVMESRRWSFRDVFALGSTLIVAPPTPLSRLESSFPDEESAVRAAYAQSFSFVNYLEQEHGPHAVRRILSAMAVGGTFPEAFRQATGADLATAERAWRDRVTWAYRWIPALTSTSVLWIVITLLVLVSRLAKRRRERVLNEAWEREGLG